MPSLALNARWQLAHVIRGTRETPRANVEEPITRAACAGKQQTARTNARVHTRFPLETFTPLFLSTVHLQWSQSFAYSRRSFSRAMVR
jgi:hypothetical protein